VWQFIVQRGTIQRLLLFIVIIVATWTSICAFPIRSVRMARQTKLTAGRKRSIGALDPVVASKTGHKANKNIDPEKEYKELYEWVRHSSVDYHKAPNAAELRGKLLSWYSKERRKLPWRGDPPPWGNDEVKKSSQKTLDSMLASADSKKTTPETAFSITPYGIWVSEIMLQQTRVEAVIPYWVRWMKEFPTVMDLAKATPDQVNAQWAGLGFYRRARFLHEAAKKVVEEWKGVMPMTVEDLLKLPGIGTYTAHAIASIAYGTSVPVVDGNVCRVLSRLLGIANHIKAPALKDQHGWGLADTLLDDTNAGSINQALMELGATYCSPTGSGMDDKDPWKGHYMSNALSSQVSALHATDRSALEDLLKEAMEHESKCPVCASDGVYVALESMITSLDAKEDVDASCLGHVALPLAPPQTSKREEVLAVAVLRCNDKWLLSRRPEKGLLAGQWEFPNVIVWSSADQKKDDKSKKNGKKQIDVPEIKKTKRKEMLDRLLESQNETLVSKRTVLEKSTEHVFSHVRHTMWIESGSIDALAEPSNPEEWKWMNKADMKLVGITSGVRKVMRIVEGQS